jgi:hypothetical protein
MQGINQKRLITLTLHIIVDDLPGASNISEQKADGLKRFEYCLLLQKLSKAQNLVVQQA